MPKLTLGQAAKEANRAKSTILDAIRSGNLSAPKGDKGQYEIDPAELFRVFPKENQEPDGRTETEHLRTDANAALLLQKVEFLERIIDGIESERDDLRGERDRLLKVIEEQAGTVKQLTHQPEPKADSLPLPVAEPASKGKLWEKLFGHR